MKQLATCLLLLVAVSPAISAGPTTYGKGVSAPDTVGVMQLLDDPESFLGRTVRVEGRVAGVCPKRGCWIEITGPDGDRSVRFKVEDGEIVFPLDAEGKHVVAEGVLTKMELTQEQAVDYMQHMAEEAGKDFDPSTVKGPMVVYLIQGAGAVID